MVLTNADKQKRWRERHKKTFEMARHIRDWDKYMDDCLKVVSRMETRLDTLRKFCEAMKSNSTEF